MYYCVFCNVLFYKGDYIVFVEYNNFDSIIYLKDYLFCISLFFFLLIMKYIGFDDNYINWDLWIDR